MTNYISFAAYDIEYKISHKCDKCGMLFQVEYMSRLKLIVHPG